MESLIYALRNSQNPILKPIFGFPARQLESDPVLQLKIISAVERDVYGTRGIDGYEREELSALKRAARRSVAQFLCQRAQLSSLWVRAAWFIGTWVSLLPLCIYLVIKSVFDSRIREDVKPGKDLVIRLLAERLRPVWNEMFKNRDFYIHSRRADHLGVKEFGFIARSIGSYPRILLYPKLLANLIRWISAYGYIVHRFKPKNVAHCSEGIASSSLITAFLHENGSRHLNLTHGERMVTAHTAFFEFDEDHLWGEQVLEVTRQLRPKVERFVIAGNAEHRLLFESFRPKLQPRPKRLLIIHNPVMTPESPDFSILVKILERLDSSWEVRIRRHPNWGEFFTNYFHALKSAPTLIKNGIQIEEESYPQVKLVDALAKSRVVAGGAGAAMIESWVAGCKVIYMQGIANKNYLMDRHCGSENVLYATENPADIERAVEFVQTPALLNAAEDNRVNYLTRVKRELDT